MRGGKGDNLSRPVDAGFGPSLHWMGIRSECSRVKGGVGCLRRRNRDRVRGGGGGLNLWN